VPNIFQMLLVNIPKADWSSVKNKQLTATPCQVLVGHEKTGLKCICKN